MFWELGRIIYNMVLLAIGLILSYSLIAEWGIVIYVFQACVFALFANLFYCLGPLSEIYLLTFGVKLGEWRYALFALGLTFSISVTCLCGFLALFHVD